MKTIETGAVFEKGERKVPLNELGDEFAIYRLSDPKTEQEVKISLIRDGQLSPIVVCRMGSVYQVLDGLKRLRAARSLAQIDNLKAKVIEGQGGKGRAAMLRLNQERKGLCMVEEALIVHGMHHEEGLAQTAIACLVNHHPAWVCRRIAMVERLHEEVVNHMKLGLVVGAMGRHIEKLPRGNQVDLLEVIEAHRLSCRETAALVSNLTRQQVFTKEAMQEEANGLVEKREKSGGKSKPAKKGGDLHQLLTHLQRLCADILAWSETSDFAGSLAMPSTMICAQNACEIAERVLKLLRKQESLG